MSENADFIEQDKQPETIEVNSIDYSEPQTDQPDAAEINIDIVYGNLTAEELLSEDLYEKILALIDPVKINRAVSLCGVIAVKKHIGKKTFERQFQAYRAQKENAAEVIDSANEPRNHGSETELYSRPYMFSKDGITYQVIKPLLHEYIRQHEKFLFVRGDASSAVHRYVYRQGVYRRISDKELMGIIRGYLPILFRVVQTINEVFNLFEMDDNYISFDNLNDNENIINMQNGILNLDTMQVTAHTPGIKSTIQIPCKYNPDAQPVNGEFDKYMDTLTGGDMGIREFLLQYIGIILSNVAGYRMKKALFMVGPGDTGKSQLKELAVQLIGKENFSGLDLPELEKRFGTAQLYGKRLGGASDMGYCNLESIHIFKMATGGDTFNAEFKKEQMFNFKYKGLLWFCMNKMPRFGGDKAEVYNRMIIISCDNVISQEKQDKKLLEKILREKEYVIKLCIDAARRVIKNGYRFTEPQSSINELKKYKIVNDSVLTFLDECTIPRTAAVKSRDPHTTGRIYEIYKRWGIANYNYHEKIDGFISALESAGKGEKEKTNGYWYYTAFEPTDECVKQYVGFNGV